MPKEMLGFHQDLMLQTMEEGSYGLDRMLGKDAGDRLRDQIYTAYKEHRIHGTVSAAALVCCVGRKRS